VIFPVVSHVDAVAVCLVSIFVTLKVLWSNQISNVAPELQ